MRPQLQKDMTMYRYLLTLKRKKTIFVAEGKDSATVKAFVEDLAQHKGRC